jgi:DNA-directed RNA polymerase alpha subunit
MTKNREYKPLIIPQLKWEKKTLSESCGELVVQPLEPGFGITIGNSLISKILLSVIKRVNPEKCASPKKVKRM